MANEAGTTISKVDYFENTTLVATATAAPFTATWDNVVAGSYSLTAKVTDSNNHSTTSAPVAITVINNTAPTVSLTANPSNGTAPRTIIVNATATDTDGTISKVELFNGASLLTTLTTAPYTYLWENVAAGSYTLTAKATDNLDKATTSSEVPVTVVAHVPKIYDIHTDHLGTPRMVTDANGNKVWEWIGTPFGESLPNQNPNNTGVQNDFTLNLRFPGQVFDRETNLHYNYFRDYDPSTGRYVQSDPIGLNGGINTYDYVNGRPFEEHDFFGLAPGLNNSNGGSGTSIGGGSGSKGSGGGQDKWYGRNDKRFRDWVHSIKQGAKDGRRGADNYTKEEIEELYEQWEEEGKQCGKGRKSGKGKKVRIVSPIFMIWDIHQEMCRQGKVEGKVGCLPQNKPKDPFEC